MPDQIIARGSDDHLPPDILSALESRADVDSLGNLHERRRQLMVNLAPLKALYGPFGLFDDRRKQMLEALKVRARQRMTEAGSKITEGAIDSAAYADPQYEQFLDQAYAAKIEFITLSTEESELQERIRSREIALLAYSAELRLQH